MATAVNIPKDAFRALVSSITGVAASRIYWQGEPERTILPIGGKAVKLTLDVIARKEEGTLEPRRTLNGGTNKLDETWGVHRSVTINVRSDNFLSAGEAFDLLENLRLRLAMPPGRKALRAMGLAFIEAASVGKLNYRVDNRDISSGTLDVIVAQVVTVDVDGGEDWIEKVNSGEPANIAAAPVVDLDFTRIT